MTRYQKSLDRLLLKPRHFSWDELSRVLGGFGYEQVSGGKTGGSRVRFIHGKHPPIILHKPHPTPALKRYQLEAIISLLREEKLI